MLGVSWKSILDFFLIKVKVCLDSSYTKRDVLSTIAKIFDPVGLMAPVISKAKIFLQRLWRSKLEWNDLLFRKTEAAIRKLASSSIDNWVKVLCA
ncbi:uncharacterized protein TNCV_2029801 [Trichonephila clavipes]|nr:uncharacterized protein TNCV_2029801 [Trichonephila clavipes]